MKITETKQGYRFISDYERRLRAQQDETAVSGACHFCDETIRASFAEVREWHAEHRAKAHPGARDRGQSARRAAAKNEPRISYSGRFRETEK